MIMTNVELLKLRTTVWCQRAGVSAKWMTNISPKVGFFKFGMQVYDDKNRNVFVELNLCSPLKLPVNLCSLL